MAGRVLFIGGIPWDSSAPDAIAQIESICPAATHIALKDPHRGWALAAFRSAEAAAAAAGALAAAAAAGRAPALGVALTVAPAQRVPASWPAEWTMSDAEVEEAASQRERAERHHAHLKRRRARQKDEMLSQLGRVLGGLKGELFGSGGGAEGGGSGAGGGGGVSLEGAPPSDSGGGGGVRSGGGGVWGQYSPLLADLAAAWRAAGGGAEGGGGGGGGGGVCVATEAVIRRLPARLARVLRPRQLERALLEASGLARAPAPGPIALAAAPDASAVEGALLFDWSLIPPAADPAFGGMLADADVIRAGADVIRRAGGGRVGLRALRKRVQVEGFALALAQLLPGARARRAARGRACGGAAAPLPQPQPRREEEGQQQQQQQQHEEEEDAQGRQQAGERAGAGGAIWVVDFGSGGGNLTIPLAWLFEEEGCRFAAVDYKDAAVAMVARRAREAGLATGTIKALTGRIEGYEGPADAVVALHACGAATDYALQRAAARRAAFVVSPCCIGKVNLEVELAAAADGGDGGEGGVVAAPPPLRRPRSRRLGGALARLQAREAGAGGGGGEGGGGGGGGPGALFASLARVADFSHQEDHGYPELAAAAKAHVELDRALAAGEAGYAWRLSRLPQPQLTAKSDVIVGWPLGP